MNLSVTDVGGGLVVSQLLYGDCRKGKQPSTDRQAGAQCNTCLLSSRTAKGLSDDTGSFRRQLLWKISPMCFWRQRE